jgi:hypothetical protein
MLRKIPYDTCVPVLARFRLSEEAAEAVVEDAAPDVALKALHKGKHFVDLIHFFGHAMPPREGVCWALSVVKDLRPDMDEADAAVCAQVAEWVRDPQEARRITLMQEGEKRENEDPIGWLCNAVAWNGSGSIGPIDGPTVLPPAGLHVSGLLGAISLLAGDTEDTFAAAVEVTFQQGMAVAQGGWPNIAT